MTTPDALAPGFSAQVLEDYEAISREATHRVLGRLRQKPDLLLCASAGGSPTGLYRRLVAHAQKEPELFKGLRVLQIDEWGGLPPGHPASCKADLWEKLIQPLGLSGDRFIPFETDATQPETEIMRVGAWLQKHGPIDICILGLGVNGHIAMNEPADTLAPRVHLARLAETSLQHAMLRGVAKKPTWGLTLGMADILQSREILLLVNGAAKQPGVTRLLRGEISTQFPASFLWLHPAATLLCDAAAFGAPATSA